MTRHNLAIHISWLLSNEVTPPVGVSAIASTHPTASAQIVHADTLEEDIEQEIPTASPSPIPNRRIVETVNVVQDFVRPALPSTSRPQPREFTNETEESMGKLASAPRSTRPVLLSLHQLATPSSTTSSTSSSLMAGYAAQLRGDGQSNMHPTVQDLTLINMYRHTLFDTND
jgi:bloom syndrome protein